MVGHRGSGGVDEEIDEDGLFVDQEGVYEKQENRVWAIYVMPLSPQGRSEELQGAQAWETVGEEESDGASVLRDSWFRVTPRSFGGWYGRHEHVFRDHHRRWSDRLAPTVRGERGLGLRGFAVQHG